MFMEERQRDIVNKVNETGRILVSEIQTRYHISADCARRDLRVLESRGLLQRTHGGAIAAKDVERIFERFYRTDESRNSKHGGSGIGLAIVKKIVEDHKGKIWAESVEGEGTTMHLNLLKAKDEENPENA